MIRVMICEDVEDVREGLKYLLNMDPEIEVVDAVPTAEKLFLPVEEHGVPNIILMAIVLPGMDGLEVLERIKQNPATADIPVIAVTAHAMKGSEEHFIEKGCVDYISKPIDINKFRALIDKYLSD